MTTFMNHGIAAALVAVLSLTALQDVQAAKNDGRFQNSPEARHVQICIELQSSYTR